MRRPVRWRRVGKWVSLSVAIVISAAWSVSGWYTAYWIWHAASGRAGFMVRTGRLDYGQSTVPIRKQEAMLGIPPGGNARGLRRWDWSFELERIGLPSAVGFELWVPLWAPWLAASFAAAWLWALDRRRPPGTCAKCGYDLTGNTTGACPECGAERAVD